MRKAKIYYARMDEFWRKKEKLDNLEKLEHIGNVKWQEIKPDKNYNWLTEGLEDEFETFVELGSKETKSAKGDVTDCLFKIYSRGVATCRDVWAYNFKFEEILSSIQIIINNYNDQVIKWTHRKDRSVKVDEFVSYDGSGITNDPNRLDDEEYIVRLIKQVITVSLETVKIVKDLPDLRLPKD